jgi:REP element-mobilizing transposase RayT
VGVGALLAAPLLAAPLLATPLYHGMTVGYDPRIHHRRSIRLAGYDYSQAGAYFVTICTHNRALSLQAEPVREVVRLAWCGLPARFPIVALDEFVIMPNHVHAIIILADAASRGAASSAPTTLGHVIRAFKSISAIEANKILGQSNRPFWQRNYYEHIIRDEEEVSALRQYIRDNPSNWLDDPDNPSNM